MESKNSSDKIDIVDESIDNNISGIRKASILIMALGEEVSSQVLKSLTDIEIKKLAYGLTSVEIVDFKERKKVLEEFMTMLRAKQYISEGGVEYAKALLSKALGNQSAQKIIKEISMDQNKPFENLRKANAEQILNAIYKESPQVIAIVLTYLQPEKAAEVMVGLPEKTKLRVAHKISNISTVPAFIIAEIETTINEKITDVVNVMNEQIDGIDTLVNILNNIDGKNIKELIENIEKDNLTLANKIKENIFTFKDIVKLYDGDIQKVLREINTKDLAYALKGMPADFVELIYKNQSDRAKETLKDEIEILGPVKVSEVEAARQKIIDTIRKLGESGIIIMPIGEQDEMVE
ncbi:MAG: flagellar motor switch protein FliG [Cetobacterium sp.]